MQRDRGRKRESHTNRETDRQTDRLTEREEIKCGKEREKRD